MIVNSMTTQQVDEILKLFPKRRIKFAKAIAGRTSYAFQRVALSQMIIRRVTHKGGR